MHELSIALNILDLAAEEANRRGNVEVVGIHVKLGPLSGVIKEALLSAFAMARTESPLCRAELMIDETPLLVHCPCCRSTQSAVSVQQLCCTVCGTPTPEVISGRELEIVALEIE